MTKALISMVALLVIAGCTEQLVTPGGCPELCPSGEVTVRDTVLSPTFGGDSAFTGYASLTDGVSILLATGGDLGDARGLIRFIPTGDSVLAADTLRAFTVDSVVLSVAVQARDTTAAGLSLDFYRLPADFDSTTTFTQIAAEMNPSTLLRTVAVPDSLRSDRFVLGFSGPELNALEFAPEDSTRLVIGVRLRGPVGAGVYLGGATSGDAAPVFVTYTDIGGTDTLIQKQPLSRGVDQNVTVGDLPQVTSSDLLVVGGFPAARTMMRFDLPAYLRDSSTILRASLELIPDRPIVGIPGDSVRIEARALLADVGAKSVVIIDPIASSWIHPGSDTVRIELADLARLWQGNDPLPPGVRISLGQEHGSFLAPVFRSTRSGSGTPRLRITYRPPLAVEGF